MGQHVNVSGLIYLRRDSVFFVFAAFASHILNKPLSPKFAIHSTIDVLIGYSPAARLCTTFHVERTIRYYPHQICHHGYKRSQKRSISSDRH